MKLAQSLSSLQLLTHVYSFFFHSCFTKYTQKWVIQKLFAFTKNTYTKGPSENGFAFPQNWTKPNAPEVIMHFTIMIPRNPKQLDYLVYHRVLAKRSRAHKVRAGPEQTWPIHEAHWTLERSPFFFLFFCSKEPFHMIRERIEFLKITHRHLYLITISLLLGGWWRLPWFISCTAVLTRIDKNYERERERVNSTQSIQLSNQKFLFGSKHSRVKTILKYGGN